MRVCAAVLLALYGLACAGGTGALASGAQAWSAQELAVLRSLWIGSLPPLPKDPSNRVSDLPKAAALGRKIFFDPRFSGDGKVSCASCHRPGMSFTDDLPLARGMGTTARRSMPLLGVAYNAWFFWDGRRDSLWSQALTPIESPVEHGIARTTCAHLIRDNYGREYAEIFGPLPELSETVCPENASPATGDLAALKAWVSMPAAERTAVNRVYANMGKAIGAYVRTILPGPSRFDRYVEALLANDRGGMRKSMTPREVEGLKLFIGAAKCTNCHNGPLFTNGAFHDTGVPDPPGRPRDPGRSAGIRKVLADEFNCLGSYSDAGPGDCAELRFIDARAERYVGAFKTPTLRNVAERPPYMDAGQFSTLREVLEFYRRSKRPELGHSGLRDVDLDRLEAFLRTLSGPVAAYGQ